MWSKKNALFVLLPATILVGIGAMVHEIRSGHRLFHSEWGSAGTAAHSPSEFSEVFAPDPLEGLTAGVGEIQVPPPPLNPETWPCSQCHDKDLRNSERRVLTAAHEDIVLHHAEESRWCLDCHDFEDRDKLHLANGEKIPFEESYRLCGQCHGPTYRDWRLGIHGKRTGYWDGSKRYLLCVNCHWPHAPKFKPLQPLPAPVRPEFLGGTPSAEILPAVGAGEKTLDQGAAPGEPAPAVKEEK
ncbi:MAG: hypothetical protein A3K19_06455 [Lentisphaerae bacterium RIFOXYB12_FULL_65_16]|nr:MAG: hypothetical protein A3K18_02185 [Lentisphaerae bacterium RIFOXYA12_64_32]OGV93081.1 MAG: hypothetical protein A3K19_06455 [Lentisphaerae bacterium RIFOXYB12_FULL_65_16]